MSIKKAKKLPKEELQDLQKNTANNMRGVASLTIDTDHLMRNRIYLCAAKAAFNWWSGLSFRLKDPDACLEHMRNMSQLGILELCENTWMTMQNLDRLLRIGFTTSFPADAVAPGELAMP